jgi:hypothetical protein
VMLGVTGGDPHSISTGARSTPRSPWRVARERSVAR